MTQASTKSVDITLRARSQGMEELVKGSAKIYMLREAFSALTPVLKKINPSLGETVEIFGRTLGTMKAVEATYGRGAAAFSGALTVGLYLWQKEAAASDAAAEAAKKHREQIRELADEYERAAKIAQGFVEPIQTGMETKIEQTAKMYEQFKREADEAFRDLREVESGWGAPSRLFFENPIGYMMGTTKERLLREAEAASTREAQARRTLEEQQEAQRIVIRRQAENYIADFYETDQQKRLRAGDETFKRLVLSLERTGQTGQALVGRDTQKLTGQALAGLLAGGDDEFLKRLARRFIDEQNRLLRGPEIEARMAPALEARFLRRAGTYATQDERRASSPEERAAKAGEETAKNTGQLKAAMDKLAAAMAPMAAFFGRVGNN